MDLLHVFLFHYHKVEDLLWADLRGEDTHYLPPPPEWTVCEQEAVWRQEAQCYSLHLLLHAGNRLMSGAKEQQRPGEIVVPSFWEELEYNCSCLIPQSVSLSLKADRAETCTCYFFLLCFSFQTWGAHHPVHKLLIRRKDQAQNLRRPVEIHWVSTDHLVDVPTFKDAAYLCALTASMGCYLKVCTVVLLHVVSIQWNL